MQLSPQFQQLPFYFFLLERLSEYLTSVSLVEACLGPQWKNSETSILRHRRLIRSVLCLTSSVFFLFVPHLESTRVLVCGSRNPHGVHPKPPSGSWEEHSILSCEVQESPQETQFI